jgi:hypothetical protein
MRLRIDLIALSLLVASAITWAAPEMSLHIDSRSLWPLERLSSGRIESLGEAAAYVRKASVLCGIADPELVPDGLESRLATAELDAVSDPSKRISDDQVAQAFNFVSGQFGVANPTRLTGADVLHYREVMSKIFPHVFSPQAVSGSRPVGAVVMLYMLVYYGGMTDGWKRVGGPSSFGISEAEPFGRPGIDRNAIAREYQAASLAYFQKRQPEEVRSFLRRVAKIIALPEGR